MKQPLAGIIATILVMAVSLGFISLFDFPLFAGWVAYLLLCIIPIQIVTAVLWRCGVPEFAGNQKQPVKGVLLLGVNAVVAAIVAYLYFQFAGAAIGPPTPMLAMCTIVSVIITFWFCIVWGGWPFTAVIRNPLAAGLVTLAAAYIVNYIIFRFVFDYGFMQGAPVYVPQLDPHGLVPAWNALAFYLTLLASMFLIVNFDLWPLTNFPSVMKQPVLGLVWTICCFVLAAIIYNIGVRGFGMDPMQFMVRVPVPFVFGTIVVQNMMQGSLFAKLKGPMKGVANALAVVVFGQVLAAFYRAMMPVVTAPLPAGGPGYDAEVWLASALLSVTFPFLIFYAEFFQFWPLQKA
ncbi:MAG: hypothetical protein ABL967_00760 [Bryobacteraceae bacterium]